MRILSGEPSIEESLVQAATLILPGSPRKRCQPGDWMHRRPWYRRLPSSPGAFAVEVRRFASDIDAALRMSFFSPMIPAQLELRHAGKLLSLHGNDDDPLVYESPSGGQFIVKAYLGAHVVGDSACRECRYASASNIAPERS